MERLGELTQAMKTAAAGRLAGRFFKLLARARGDLMVATRLAESAGARQVADVCKAAVGACTHDAQSTSGIIATTQDASGWMIRASGARP